MNNPKDKPGQSQDQIKQQRQREQQQAQEQLERDKAGKKPSFDKDQIPQGGPQTTAR
jgi:hypothetical protein